VDAGVSDSVANSWFEAQGIAQQRVFVRALAISFALHVGIALSLLIAPKSAPVYAPTVISVRMVSLPAAAPPVRARAQPQSLPKKAPTPVPIPAQPKLPPAAKKVILPKRAAPVSKKPKPKPKPLEYDDALASLREELGEETPPAEAAPTAAPPVPQDDAQTAAPESSGGGVEADPEVVAWRNATLRHVNKFLRVPQEFMNRALSTVLILTVTSSGDVLGYEIVRSSDNPYWDDNVLRALDQASPLPPPPTPGDWTFRFTPDKL
jgi:protein TonB